MIEAELPPELPWSGASVRLLATSAHAWITPAEQTGFSETPNYAQTRAWLERLDKASSRVRMETFGVSAQGRELLVVFVRAGGRALDPAKPVLLVQAGIHSGEIDGKDAGLMLLRDIAMGGRADLVEHVNLVFVPILNVDGHERSGRFNRPNQRGPSNQGWRNTAQNLNLNRDYTKLDAPETRALVGLLRRVRPTLYLDIHVTDGMDYQHDITYGFQGSDGSYAASPRIAEWLNQHYRRGIDAALLREGHSPGDLIFAVDDRNPLQGLAGFAFSPRFSQAYGDAIHMASVLVENHSLKPYRQRVLGTYVLIEASLRLLAEHGTTLAEAARADAQARPERVPAGWRQSDQTRSRELLPVEHERYRSVASGRDEVRWTGRAAPAMQIAQHSVEPTLELARPKAYWVPVTKPDVIEVLRLHGVQFETLDAPRSIPLEMLRLPDASLSDRASEGRQRASSGRPAHERRTQEMPAGSIRVPTDQPLGDLAMILLEPESEDSFFAWGFFNEIMQRVEYMESYAMAPYADAMLEGNPALRAEFEARLAADPTFAADGDARLAWLYARSPYADDRYRLYPVGIER